MEFADTFETNDLLPQHVDVDPGHGHAIYLEEFAAMRCRPALVSSYMIYV